MSSHKIQLNSCSSIISISLLAISLLICVNLSPSACLAASLNAEPSAIGHQHNQQHKHHQDGAQLNQKDSSQPSSLSSSSSQSEQSLRHTEANTLGQLMLGRLAKQSLGSDMEQADGDQAAAKMLLAKKKRKSTTLGEYLLMQNQNYNQQQEQQFEANKLALKRKWHKLVDDLIEGELSDDNINYNNNNNAKLMAPLRKSALATTDDDQSNDNILVILKKRPSTLEAESMEAAESQSQQQQQQVLSSLNNQLDESIRKQQMSAPSRGPVNMAEHARRILDDKYGILKDSLFTTNNHLGLKGVPKLGSDEEF